MEIAAHCQIREIMSKRQVTETLMVCFFTSYADPLVLAVLLKLVLSLKIKFLIFLEHSVPGKA